MIVVKDDVVSSEYSEKILNLVSGLDYLFSPETTMTKEYDCFGKSYSDQYIYDNGQSVCVIMYDENVHEKYKTQYEALQPLIEYAKQNIMGAEILGIDRIKVNVIKCQPDSPSFHYNIPHKDFPDFIECKHHSMVYYCEDSDGDTFLFEQFHNPLETPDQLIIEKRVSPKKNRAVIFESNRWHSSSNPRNHASRTVINFIFNTKPV